jgi:hypothetical protein
MPEPLSTLGLCLVGYTALNVYARGGSAISTEAEHAEKAATELVGSAERSVVLFGEKIDAISQLRAMANECSEPGWDGDAAASMHPDAVYLAEQFVRALPAGIPLPEFAPEPDGSVSLDWIKARNRMFTVSVGTSQRLAFAWLDGTDKGHGVAGFDVGRIPTRIIEGIKGIMNDDNATLRAA